MKRQTILDQLLNRFALESSSFRKFCFKRECGRNDSRFDRHRENVFIAGMARSGSTALLNRLYAGGGFASTTYAMMPFVLAPSLSTVIAGIPKAAIAASERRHGDGIDISLESAEALDSIFWNTFLPQKGSHWQALDLTQPMLQRYTMFIENILIHTGKNRYLSKMNQAFALLAPLVGHFDRSIFLVPFRDPLQQASSLMRQHQNFAQLTAYEKKYLGWLGHHEFGALHRGFFDNYQESSAAFAPDHLNYWLQQWENSYSFLAQLADMHRRIIPLGYEAMACSKPLWKLLSGQLQTDISGDQFVDRNNSGLIPPADIDSSLYDRCGLLYQRLSEQSRSRVC